MHDYFARMIKIYELDPVDVAWGVKQEELYAKWYGDGHYAKYVMKANDSTQMSTIERYISERGFQTYLVIDEGHTEETWMVPTAMSVELVDKDDERTSECFGNFRMFKEPRPTFEELPEPEIENMPDPDERERLVGNNLRRAWKILRG